jgi:hypothetical protein
MIGEYPAASQCSLPDCPRPVYAEDHSEGRPEGPVACAGCRGVPKSVSAELTIRSSCACENFRIGRLLHIAVTNMNRIVSADRTPCAIKGDKALSTRNLKNHRRQAALARGRPQLRVRAREKTGDRRNVSQFPIRKNGRRPVCPRFFQVFPKAWKKKNFSDDLSNSDRPVRLYREGRASGPPKTL